MTRIIACVDRLQDGKHVNVHVKVQMMDMIVNNFFDMRLIVYIIIDGF